MLEPKDVLFWIFYILSIFFLFLFTKGISKAVKILIFLLITFLIIGASLTHTSPVEFLIQIHRTLSQLFSKIIEMFK